MASSRMVSKSFLLVLSCLLMQCSSLCLAQDVDTNAGKAGSSTTIPSQSSPTSSAPAQTHTIQVGLADHKFKPDVTKAAIGDTVEFRFYPANHSVVRAEYRMPCIPYEMTGPKKSGFFSGFNAVDKVVDDPPKYSIKINDTSPIFFYCSAPGSCITYGMVGAINPNSSTPITTQQSLAKGSAYMLNPGEPFPAEAPLASDMPGTTVTSVPIGGGNGSTKKHGLSTGAVAGIVIAAISVIVLGALLFFFVGRNKSLKDEVERKESSITRRTDSTAAIIQVSSPSTNPGLGVWQHYVSPQPQPQPFTSPPQPNLSHNHNDSISSFHSPPSPATYCPPLQQDQKYASPTIAQHPAFGFHNASTSHASPVEHISPATYELPHDSYFTPSHQPPQQAHVHPSLQAAATHDLSRDVKLSTYGHHRPVQRHPMSSTSIVRLGRKKWKAHRCGK